MTLVLVMTYNIYYSNIPFKIECFLIPKMIYREINNSEQILKSFSHSYNFGFFYGVHVSVNVYLELLSEFI
jgi:hypothetical protein